MEQEIEQAQTTQTSEKIFGLYSLDGIKIEDPGLKRYINLDAKLVLKTHGRSRERFAKAKVSIVERMANLIGVPGHRGKKHKIMTNWASGKYTKNMKTILEAFRIIEKQKNQNPIQVLVKAIENASPRDEITVIEYGGARYPQAVDVSPLRRVNLAMRHIVHGAYDGSFNKKTKIPEALAKEIMLAADGNMESFAMKKKNESEKQADSAR
jgi:small subunit ribosomal protein S7